MTVDFASSALIGVDVQNDFCPGYALTSGEKLPDGSLAVGRGDEVIAPLNALALRFASRGGKVIATQDWHPKAHVSFAASHRGKKAGDILDLPGGAQVLWPVHCVEGSLGAAFHERLDLRPVNFIIRKGYREALDSYSAFFENDRKTSTGLGALLGGLGIETVFLGGTGHGLLCSLQRPGRGGSGF